MSSSQTPDQQNQLIEIIDFDANPWYRIMHIVQSQYRPIIGQAGMDLYNLYAHVARAPRDDAPFIAQIDSRIIIDHLDIGNATLTECNNILEWCELITIPNRARRQINQVYLLHPKHLVREHNPNLRYMKHYLVPIEYQLTLATLNKRIEAGTEPKKFKSGGTSEGKYKLRNTLLARIEKWQSLDLRWTNNGNITTVKPNLPPRLQPNQPSLFDDHAAADELKQQLIPILGEKSVKHQLSTFGPDRCGQALELLPAWIDFYTRRDGSIGSQSGILIWLIKNQPGPAPEPGAEDPDVPDVNELMAAVDQRQATEAARLAAAGLSAVDISAWHQVREHVQLKGLLRGTEPIRRDNGVLIVSISQQNKEILEARARAAVDLATTAAGLSAVEFEIV